MAVGFDATTEFPTAASAGASLTLTLSWNHTPVTSTPRGVGLFVSYAPSSLTAVTTVRYGGVDLTRYGFARDAATEPGVMEFWYLGAGVPTGTQAFNVVTGSTGAGMWGVGFTVSASASTTVSQVLIFEDNQALSERTLSTVEVGMCFAGAYWGGATAPGVGANSTTLHDIDYGAYAARVVRETTAGSGKRLVGFSAITDDVAAIYVAIDEEIAPTQDISATGIDSAFTTGLAALSQETPSTATYTLSATIPAGWKYTTIGTPNTASQYSVAYSSSPVLATGDLVIFQKWARSGGSTVSASITVSTDGIVAFTPRSASASLSFQYFFWDDSVSAYGSTLTWLAPPILSLSPSGLASNFATGVPALSWQQFLTVTGLSSSFSAGTPTLTEAAAETATYTLSVTVPAGWKYTTLGTPNTVSQYSVANSSSPVLSASDIVLFQKWARSGGVTLSSSVTISTDGIVTFSPRSASASLSFQYFFWDDSASAYGSTVTWVSPPIKSLLPSGLASGFTTGLANLTAQKFLLPSGLPSAEAYGTASLYSRAYLSATGVPSGQAFGTHTVLAGLRYVSATGVSSNFAVGSHVISSEALETATYSLSVTVPSGWKYTVLSNPDISSTANIAYGQSATVASGDIVLFEEYARKNGTTTSYSITISTDGSIVVFAQSDSSSLSFQYFFWDDSTSDYGTTATFSILEWTVLQPSGLASGAAFGAHAIAAQRAVLSVSSVNTFAAFGSHTVSPGDVFISATGLASAAAFGSHTVLAGKVLVSPTGLSSSEAFGSHSIVNKFSYLFPTGLSSNESYGLHSVLAGRVFVSASGVPSTSSLGSHTVLAGQVFLSASGLSSFAAIGLHNIENKFAYIVPTGLSSSFSTGLADIYAAGAAIRTTGLGSDEAFGQHTVEAGDVILIPTGYYSPEEFGTHFLAASGVVIQPTGLESSASFGTAVLTSFAGIQAFSLDSGQAFGQHRLVFTQYISPSGKSYFAIGVARINEAGVVVPLPVQDIFEWLYESGITGGVMKRTKEYLKLQGFTGTTNTALFKWLRSLGYTKGLTNMLDKFERDNTNQHGPE